MRKIKSCVYKQHFRKTNGILKSEMDTENFRMWLRMHDQVLKTEHPFYIIIYKNYSFSSSCVFIPKTGLQYMFQK